MKKSLALLLCVLLALSALAFSASAVDNVEFEFENQTYEVTGGVWMENPYKHDALPVDAVIYTNFYAAGATATTNSLVISEDGVYSVLFRYITNSTSAAFSLSIDGKTIGDTVNLHTETTWVAANSEMGKIELKAGTHSVTLTSVSTDVDKWEGFFDGLTLTYVKALDSGDGTPDDGKEPENPNTADGAAVVSAAAVLISVLGGIAVCSKKRL